MELESFREEFTAEIKQAVTEFEQDMESTITEFTTQLRGLSDEMKREVSDDATLNAAVQALSGKLDQYDAAVKKLAAATRTGLKVAANSAGLPV